MQDGDQFYITEDSVEVTDLLVVSASTHIMLTFAFVRSRNFRSCFYFSPRLSSGRFHGIISHVDIHNDHWHLTDSILMLCRTI